MSDLSELAAAVSALVLQAGARDREWRDWLAGTVGGGAAGDGRYPITDAHGTVHQLLCPAAWQVGQVPAMLAIFAGDRCDAGEVLAAIPATLPLVMPGGLAGSQAHALAAPAATAVLSLQIDSIQVGTISFAAGATVGVITGAGGTCGVGQVLRIVAPSPADSDLAGISISLALER